MLVINMTRATIDATVATMTDNKPKVNLVPSDQAQAVYIDTLNAVIDSIWRRRDVVFAIQDGVRHSLIYGIGVAKIFWNPELEGGIGDVDVSVPSPWSIWVQPKCKSFKDSDFVFQGDWVNLSYVKRTYPENAKYLRPGMGGPKSKDEMKRKMQAENEPALYSPTDSGSDMFANAFGEKNAQKNQHTQNNEVFLMECWFLDDEEEIEEVDSTAIDPNDNTVSLVTNVVRTKKYPYGRVVTRVGNVVLRDIPAPYKSEEWPYVLFRDNIDPEEGFYGTGEVELLEDLQKELNKRRSQIADHANLMGNGVWIVDDRARVDPEKLTNKPGLVITKVAGSEVRRDYPGSLPNYILESGPMIIRDMQNVTGVGDVLGGLVPKGIRSGAGLSEAQDIAATRVRLKVKQMERAIVDIARIMIRLIQQFYTEEKVIAILGANKDVQWVPFSGSNLRGDWDVIIGAGSTLPVSKTIRFEQAVRLYQLNIIDRRAVLDAADWPGREDVLRRLGDGQMSEEEPTPYGTLDSPPSKTDNSRSRRTGRSMLADTQVTQDSQPGPSETFGGPPS